LEEEDRFPNAPPPIPADLNPSLRLEKFLLGLLVDAAAAAGTETAAVASFVFAIVEKDRASSSVSSMEKELRFDSDVVPLETSCVVVEAADGG
jgi:hypothetical protein